MDDIMGKIQEVLSDEESMKQLSELASSIFSGEENDESETDNAADAEPESSGNESGFDFGKLLMLGQIMSSASNDKNAELLLALRPLLKEERQAKVDRAVKMLKLYSVWSVLKESGMLNDIF